VASTLKLSNNRIQRMYNALTVLGNRRMANINADLKVTRMLRALAGVVEPLEERRTSEGANLVIEETSGGSVSLTPMQEEVLKILLAKKQAEIDSDIVEVDLPTQWALRVKDLPKEESGKDGWTNAAQLGALCADLGALFVDELPVEDEE